MKKGQSEGIIRIQCLIVIVAVGGVVSLAESWERR